MSHVPMKSCLSQVTVDAVEQHIIFLVLGLAGSLPALARTLTPVHFHLTDRIYEVVLRDLVCSGAPPPLAQADPGVRV